MSKFTPGPWYVVDLLWDDSDCVVANREDPHGAEIICDTSESMWHGFAEDDVERWQANAVLIAAAPDLLAACKALIAQAVSSVEYSDWPALQAAVEQGYAAIAKAQEAGA